MAIYKQTDKNNIASASGGKAFKRVATPRTTGSMKKTATPRNTAMKKVAKKRTK